MEIKEGAFAGKIGVPRELTMPETLRSQSLDRITKLVARSFDASAAAVALLEGERLIFESTYGIDVEEETGTGVGTPIEEVVHSGEPLEIGDLSADLRYAQTGLATRGLQYFAAVPLTTRKGQTLGALCVFDHEARIEQGDLDTLLDFGGMVISQLEWEHEQGRHDPISGLPNAKQLVEDLADTGEDGTPHEMVAVLLDLADPRQFGQLLGVLGPVYIEDVLRRALDVIRSVVEENVRVYHVKTMSFLMLLDPAKGDTWQHVVRQCSEKLVAPVRCNGIPVPIQSVFGIAPFHYPTTSGRDVIRTAMSAASEARSSEVVYALYNAASDRANRRRFAILNDARASLSSAGQFSLSYQPRVDLRTRVCCGGEALLRWRHPELGPVSPGEFIPLMEQTALIGPVTRWVLHEVLDQVSTWHKAGVDLRISMNVSARNLEDPNFYREVELALLASEVPPRLLEVEFTESALIRNRSRVVGQLNRIRALGIELAIDDFGSGYSSFSYLHKLPASVVKLDGSFMQRLMDNVKDQIMVRAVISMAHEMGYRVVAEGVETQEVLRFLVDAECDEVQGYLFSKPLPPNEFLSWVQDRPDRSPQTMLSRLEQASAVRDLMP